MADLKEEIQTLQIQREEVIVSTPHYCLFELSG